jgi:hypothetical protein
MKYIKLFENHYVDELLDKISKHGLASISDHERKMLDTYSKTNKILDPEESLVSFLDDNFTGLNQIEQKEKSFNTESDVILFLDNDAELVMKYNKSKKVLSLLDTFWKNIEHLNIDKDSHLIDWTKSNYNLNPNRIDTIYTNWE